jgi:asparagine synthase (glutamine-hydrolysing)
MGQFLIIQGEDQRTVRGLLDRALATFAAMCGLNPNDQYVDSATAIAKFPRLLSGPENIYRDPKPASGWACSAGTVLFEGQIGAHALTRLHEMLPQESPFRSALSDTEGQFALAFGSGDDLIVATDKLGTLHAYVAQIDGCAVVSTSSMVLAALMCPPWDMVSCREFLATGTVFEQRTLFVGIEKLPPATIFRFRGGREQSRSRYWNLADVMYDRAPFRGDVGVLAEALEEAVKMIGRAFRRPLMDLTGGFDSRALLGAMLQAGLDFDLAVHGSEGDPDVVAAKNIARRFGLRLHHEPKPTTPADRWRWAAASLPLTDGEADLLTYGPVYEGHSLRASDFDVTINGSNGEICKGYWWELLLPFVGWHGHFDEHRVAAGRFAWQGDANGLLAQPFDDDLASHCAGVIRRANTGLENHPNTAKMDNVYLTLRMQRWQGRFASATSRLWPCISPFMFRRPMEAALSAPPRSRVRHRMSRRLIERLNPVLAAMPLADGSPALPLSLATAHHFWPLAAALLSKAAAKVNRPGRSGRQAAAPPPAIAELTDIRELLRPDRMKSADLYNPRFLARLEKEKPCDVLGNRLGVILTLEMLARAVRRGASAASTAGARSA